MRDYGTDDAAEAYAITRGYPAGSISVCYVDPADASRAVLSRPSVSASIWFLGAVIAGTAAALWFYCIPQLRGRLKTPRRNTGRGKLVFAVISGIAMFCLFGGLFVASYALPMAQQIGALSWQPVPCTIVESNVQWNEQGGEIHLATYRTDIHYRYDWNGREYHSNQFNMTEGSTVFSCLRVRAIRGFHPGMRTTCFVDPRHPEEAVLARRLSPGLLMGAFLLAFGLTMLWTAILLMRGGDSQANAAFLRHWRVIVWVGVVVLVCMVAAQILPP